MPFPSSGVFRCLPCMSLSLLLILPILPLPPPSQKTRPKPQPTGRKEIAGGMLGANLKPTPATSLPPAYTGTHANQLPHKHPT
ncbi:hypothetical protein EDB19DRAFT_1758115 [Suillus lakei]|nr:hypothetical protein EDB19DRAFT_1758115 [Suillus lakei]